MLQSNADQWVEMLFQWRSLLADHAWAAGLPGGGISGGTVSVKFLCIATGACVAFTGASCNMLLEDGSGLKASGAGCCRDLEVIGEAVCCASMMSCEGFAVVWFSLCALITGTEELGCVALDGGFAAELKPLAALP